MDITKARGRVQLNEVALHTLGKLLDMTGPICTSRLMFICSILDIYSPAIHTQEDQGSWTFDKKHCRGSSTSTRGQ